MTDYEDETSRRMIAAGRVLGDAMRMRDCLFSHLRERLETLGKGWRGDSALAHRLDEIYMLMQALSITQEGLVPAETLATLRASLAEAQAGLQRVILERDSAREQFDRHVEFASAQLAEAQAEIERLKARSPAGWYCCCGWPNGINLAECACCSRHPGGPENPCTIFTADGAQ